MAISNEKANKLVEEGIDLSSEIIAGIYASKRRKKITILISLLIVLFAVVVVLWKISYVNFAAAIGVAGVISLILLLMHEVKQLRAVKRELNALNHYIKN